MIKVCQTYNLPNLVGTILILSPYFGTYYDYFRSMFNNLLASLKSLDVYQIRLVLHKILIFKERRLISLVTHNILVLLFFATKQRIQKFDGIRFYWIAVELSWVHMCSTSPPYLKFHKKLFLITLSNWNLNWNILSQNFLCNIYY